MGSLSLWKLTTWSASTSVSCLSIVSIACYWRISSRIFLSHLLCSLGLWMRTLTKIWILVCPAYCQLTMLSNMPSVLWFLTHWNKVRQLGSSIIAFYNTASLYMVYDKWIEYPAWKYTNAHEELNSSDWSLVSNTISPVFSRLLENFKQGYSTLFTLLSLACSLSYTLLINCLTVCSSKFPTTTHLHWFLVQNLSIKSVKDLYYKLL